MVPLVMSVGTPKHAFSSFAFLGEAEALEDARMFWGFLVSLLPYVQEIGRIGTRLGFCGCLCGCLS